MFEERCEGISWWVHKGHLPDNFGSEPHRPFMWDWCEQAPPFHQMLAVAKEGRWYQSTSRGHESMPYWPAVDLVLEYMGLITGWRKHVADTVPVCPDAGDDAAGGGDAAAPPFVPPPPPVASANADRNPIAASNDDVNSRMKKSKNMFHCISLSISNHNLHSLWGMLTETTLPLMVTHGDAIRCLEIRTDGRAWRIFYA